MLQTYYDDQIVTNDILIQVVPVPDYFYNRDPWPVRVEEESFL